MISTPFECPICFQLYDDASAKPTTLLCGHSLCIAHIPQMQGRCPVCRSEIKKPMLLKPSTALRDGAILYQKMLRHIAPEVMDSIYTESAILPGSVPALKVPPPPKNPSPTTNSRVTRVTFTTVPPAVAPAVEAASLVASPHEMRELQRLADLDITAGDEELARRLQEEWNAEVPQPHSHQSVSASGNRRFLSITTAYNTTSSTTTSTTDFPRMTIIGPPTTAATPTTTTTTRTTTAAAQSSSHAAASTRSVDEWFRQSKACGHYCSPNSLETCCFCSDLRPVQTEGTYPQYVDGRGWENIASRSYGYCPVCKRRDGQQTPLGSSNMQAPFMYGPPSFAVGSAAAATTTVTAAAPHTPSPFLMHASPALPPSSSPTALAAPSYVRSMVSRFTPHSTRSAGPSSSPASSADPHSSSSS